MVRSIGVGIGVAVAAGVGAAVAEGVGVGIPAGGTSVPASQRATSFFGRNLVMNSERRGSSNSSAFSAAYPGFKPLMTHQFRQSRKITHTAMTTAVYLL